MKPFLIKQGPNGEPDPTALRADQIIKNHVIAAMAAGLVPLPPVFDIASVTVIEVHMIAKLAEAYEVPVPQRHVLGKVMMSLIGGIAPVYLSVKSSELAKTVPFLGYAVYLGALSIWGGVSVYAIGKMFQEHFESGGTFLSGDNKFLKSFFEQKRAEGKARIPFLVAKGAEPA